MANEVGALLIRLEASTAALRKDMGEARKLIKDNTDQMTKSLGSLKAAGDLAGRAIGSLGVGLGIGAMIAYAKQVRDTVGGLGEMADQAGISTDALQALQFQAIQSGSSAEQMQQGLERLTRSIGDASEGNDQLINRFKGLGVAILNSNGTVRSTEAVLEEVAVALFKIDDPAKRAAAVVDLFGKSGQRLIPTLQEIANGGLSPLMKQAKDAGAVLDKELIDRFDKLSDNAAKFGMVLTVQVANVLSKIIDLATEAGKAIANSFSPDKMPVVPGASGPRGARRPNQAPTIDVPTPRRNPRSGIGRRVIPVPGIPGGMEVPNIDLPGPPSLAPRPNKDPVSTKDLQQQIAATQFLDQLKLQADGMMLLESAQLRLRMEREKDREVVNGQIQEKPRWTKAQIEEAVAIQQGTEALKRKLEYSQRILDDAKGQDDAMARQAQFFDDLKNKRNDYLRDQQKQNELTDQQTALIAKSTIEWNGLTQSYELVNKELLIFNEQQRILQMNLGFSEEQAKALATTNVEASERQRKANEAQNVALKKQQQFLNDLGDIGSNAWDRIGSAITQAYVTGEKSAISFGSVMMGVISEIAQGLIKLAIINPIKDSFMSSFGGGIKDFFGNIFGGGGTPVGNFGATFGGPRAGGGPVGTGKMYLVGEEGPELVSFGAAGHVYPAGQSAAMMGGGMFISQADVDVTIIDQRAGGQPAPVETRKQKGPDGRMQIKMLVKDVLPEIIKEGGLDRSMQTAYGSTRQPIKRS